MTSRLSFLSLFSLFLLLITTSSTSASALSSSDCYAPSAYPVPVWRSLPAGQQNRCPPGFYCPFIVDTDNSTWPSICPATDACAAERSDGRLCTAQGKYEPIVCPEGRYCPDFRTLLLCPSGYYCPLGTTEPRSCDSVSYCPEGTAYPRFWGGFLWIVLFDALVFFLYDQYRRYALRERATQRERDANNALVQSVLSQGATARLSRLPKFTQNLCRGFDRARLTVKSLEFDFDQLGLVVRKKGVEKVILRGVSGRIRPGRVTAIQGPSGAGKTSFLSVLLNKLDANCERRGTLLINGENVTIDRFREIVGYVPQDDVMHPELTVYENIWFSAKCRLPKSWTEQHIDQHVEAIIMALQLNHVRDSIIGDSLKRGISGGQRKRVNIGMELAAAPLALFLDEPTSGLDSTSSLEVIRLLQNIAQATGITIAMVIHQPRIEIFSSFDDLLFLAPGGRTVYQGPQKVATAYFERELGVQVPDDDNPADLFMDAIAEHADEYVKRWAERGPKAVKVLEAVVDQQELHGVRANDDDDADDVNESSRSQASRRGKARGKVRGKALAAAVAAASGAATRAFPNTSVESHSASERGVQSSLVVGFSSVHTAAIGANVGAGLGAAGSAGTSAGAGAAAGAGSAATIETQLSPASVTHRPDSTIVNVKAVDHEDDEEEQQQLQQRQQQQQQQQQHPAANATASANATSPASSLTAAWDPKLHGASFFQQLVYCHNRSLRQQHARIGQLIVEALTCSVVGLVMAVTSSGRYRGIVADPFALISAAPREQAVPQMALFLCLGITLVSCAAGVTVFSSQIPVYWREAAAGHSKLAFYTGVNLANVYRCFICAIHFTFTYHLVSVPYTSFNYMLLIVFALMYTWYGFSAFVSWAYMGENSALVAIVVSIVWSVCNGYVSAVPSPVQYLSGARWATEALFWLQAEKMRHVYQLDTVSKGIWHFSLDQVPRDIVLIFVVGTVWRVLGFFMMVGRYRNKQR